MKNTKVFIGKVNPPHRGHETIIKNCDRVFLTENAYPLTFKERSKVLGRYGNLHPKPVKDFIHMMKILTSKGVKNVEIICGADREKTYKRIAKNYNGKLFTFNRIVINSYNREDIPISSTIMRKLVQANRFDDFCHYCPETLSLEEKTELFKKVNDAIVQRLLIGNAEPK